MPVYLVTPYEKDLTCSDKIRSDITLGFVIPALEYQGSSLKAAYSSRARFRAEMGKGECAEY